MLVEPYGQRLALVLAPRQRPTSSSAHEPELSVHEDQKSSAMCGWETAPILIFYFYFSWTINIQSDVKLHLTVGIEE